jgi:hypothetical protein
MDKLYYPVESSCCHSTNVEELVGTTLMCLSCGKEFEHPNPEWYAREIHE